ncbi:hypothetical protein J1614_005228 [Plenodomus biglobosus]|nr:hypothetical protein J1614_005228 [Plenodomus biglobosus]
MIHHDILPSCACHARRVQCPSSHILLLVPPSVLTPHSFSNSSSQGTLAWRCSGSTGELTLWCSTVQNVVFPSMLVMSPRIMAICFPTLTTRLFRRTCVPIGTAFRYEILRERVTPPMNSQKPGRAIGHKAVVVAMSNITPAAPPCITSCTQSA